MNSKENATYKEQSGVDPQTVLQQVLERVATQPHLATDLVHNQRLKDALYAVCNQHRLHQILAMDRQTIRKYRTDQENRTDVSSWSRRTAISLEEAYDEDDYEDDHYFPIDRQESIDEWIDDDDCGYVQIPLSSHDTIECLDRNQCFEDASYLDQEVEEELEEDVEVFETGVPEAIFELTSYAVNIPKNLDMKKQGVPSQTSSRPSSFVQSPAGNTPTAALWPREPNEFQFSQEAVESMQSSDEVYSESSVNEYEADSTDVVDSRLVESPCEDELEAKVEALQSRNELETLHLPIIRKKMQTGFEADKDFPGHLGSFVAERYRIVDLIGEAAFSITYRGYDKILKREVCLKVIKNNKDYFDQGIDEIQVLKYLNKAGDCNHYHIVELYDYFYYKEHLFIVMELLQENLYEYARKIRKLGQVENYFTLDKIQKVMRECLHSLKFVHSLNILHCDLKPENIVIENADLVSIKIIDFGSACFTTDRLSSYVQSRSYRAPEVLLGLRYDHKIDLWSLGCIAAELYTGRVLFTNECVSSLLARMVSILGEIPYAMLGTSPYSPKYFTKKYMVYKQIDEETAVILRPKTTSLWHRLRSPDEEFVNFVSSLLSLDPEERPSAEEALCHPWLQQ